MAKSSTPRASILMCPPAHFTVVYEINPWMSVRKPPDAVRAAHQWETLRATLAELNVEIRTIDGVPGCPDMVFTANAGLVVGNTALISRFRYRERTDEEPYFREWFASNGYRVLDPPPGCRFEGEGDALLAGDVILAGYIKRTDIASHNWMSNAVGRQVLSLELTDERWYHLDTCLTVLDSETVACYRSAFDEYGLKVLESNFRIVDVEQPDAIRFTCNSIVIENDVVQPGPASAPGPAFGEAGLKAHAVDLDEFMKAGGAAKCLALFLRRPGEST